MINVIKRNWFYNNPREEVWEYLTNAELISKWLMPNNFKLEVGYEFEFWTNPIPELSLDGNFYCKVIEIIPQKKLVYSWRGGPNKNNPTLDTIVTWNLLKAGNRTELRLVHTGFKDENGSILSSMYNGWDEHIQKMITKLKDS